MRLPKDHPMYARAMSLLDTAPPGQAVFYVRQYEHQQITTWGPTPLPGGAPATEYAVRLIHPPAGGTPTILEITPWPTK